VALVAQPSFEWNGALGEALGRRIRIKGYTPSGKKLPTKIAEILNSKRPVVDRTTIHNWARGRDLSGMHENVLRGLAVALGCDSFAELLEHLAADCSQPIGLSIANIPTRRDLLSGVEYLLDALPERVDFTAWRAYDSAQGVLMTLVHQAMKERLLDGRAVTLFARYAEFLGKKNERRAHDVYVGVLDLAKLTHGEDSLEAANVMIDFGVLLRHLAERQRSKRRRGQLLGRAIALLEHGTAIRHRRLGENDVRSLRATNGLAAAYLDNRDIARAETLVNRELVLLGQRREPDDRQTRKGLNLQGRIFLLKGDLRGADALVGTARKIAEEKLGKDHLDLAYDHRELGAISLGLGDRERAEEHRAEALRIVRSHIHWPRHPFLLQLERVAA
jgi:hypothetical protein